MDSNWLKGMQSINQLSNLITLSELLIFPHGDDLMKRNEVQCTCCTNKNTSALPSSADTRYFDCLIQHDGYVCVVCFAGDVRTVTAEDGETMIPTRNPKEAQDQTT